jgi:hypothetical protein
MVMDQEPLISADKLKKAKIDFLKSPSDFSAQYRYGVAMIHSKNKKIVEEGCKLLKELCSVNTTSSEICMCFYHICYGSLRVNKYPDVRIYADKLYAHYPTVRLTDKEAANENLIIQKTQGLVILADEFSQNPQLSKLLDDKRKRGLKSILQKRNLHRKDKIENHVRSHSLTSKRTFTEIPPNKIILSELTNANSQSNSSNRNIILRHASHDLTSIPNLQCSPSVILDTDSIPSKKRFTAPPTLPADTEKPEPRRPLSFHMATSSSHKSSTDMPDSILDPEPCVTKGNKNSDGEILELKETLTQLRAMYDNIYGFENKNVNMEGNGKGLEREENTNPSSQNNSTQNQEEGAKTGAQRLTAKTQPVNLELIESESNDRVDNITSKNTYVIERALEPLPALQLPNTHTEYITRMMSKPEFGLPAAKKPRLATLSKTMSVNDPNIGNRPWVIIRRYGMRGGKKIRLPNTLEELIQVSGEKLGITAACIREVTTEAEIEDIRAVESQSVLWVMTEDDELSFQ